MVKFKVTSTTGNKEEEKGFETLDDLLKFITELEYPPKDILLRDCINGKSGADKSASIIICKDENDEWAIEIYNGYRE